MVDLGDGEFVDLAVPIEHIEPPLAAAFRLLRQQVLGPDFLDPEASGELHQLPPVRLAGAPKLLGLDLSFLGA